MEQGDPLEALELLCIDVEPERSSTARPEGGDRAQSRNVLRKLRNWERRVAARRGRRKEEKMRRKQRRATESAGNAKGEEPGRRAEKLLVKERLASAQTTGPRLCVDLSVSYGMSAKETSRLAAQIRRLYGANRRATTPFHLYLAGLQEDSLLYQECCRMNDGFRDYAIDVTEQSFLELFPRDSVVYLTPDAEQGRERLEPDKVYVLGGLVDESVQKKVTYLKAQDGGVCSARLPIDEHMVKRINQKNFHSQILAINQVFDVLLSFCETGSWSVALAKGVPSSKGYKVSPESAAQPHH
ncbi:hypothetical protein GN956_G806 [Arapaima gigas]